MTSPAFNTAITALNALTAEELNDLVPHWKMIAKQKRSIRGAAIVSKEDFQVGDVLTFFKSGHGKHAGQVYFKFTNMNRNNTAAQGPECTAEGEDILPRCKWTVDPAKCTKHVFHK